MKLLKTALLATIALRGCAVIAPEQTSVSTTHFESPAFQTRPIGALDGYSVDFLADEVIGSGTQSVRN